MTKLNKDTRQTQTQHLHFIGLNNIPLRNPTAILMLRPPQTPFGLGVREDYGRQGNTLLFEKAIAKTKDGAGSGDAR